MIGERIGERIGWGKGVATTPGATAGATASGTAVTAIEDRGRRGAGLEYLALSTTRSPLFFGWRRNASNPKAIRAWQRPMLTAPEMTYASTTLRWISSVSCLMP